MDTRIDSRTGLEELDRGECLSLLEHAPLGRLAVVVAGHPLVFPVNFTLDGDAVVFRTGWSVLVLAIAEEVHDPTEIARLDGLPLGPWCAAPKPVWLRLRARSI